MTIQEAINCARQSAAINYQGDNAITRHCWKAGKCLIISTNDESEIHNEVRDVWLPTVSDLLATDWLVYQFVLERHLGF